MKENRVDYEINSSTMAIRCARHLEYQSMIMEPDRTCYSAHTPLKLINQACLDKGSSYSGRLESARHKLCIYNKIPVLVDQFEEIILFPTHSPSHIDNTWISIDHYKKILPHSEKGKAIVQFINGERLTVNCSVSTFQRQYQRAATILIHEIHLPKKRMNLYLRMPPVRD
ncbi:hypothetical protein KP77_28310 [Jeotgalibacillus alimentarius]|uniref:Competence protein ComK n=1 Tax=Jeotgalibacillus alimentarius TaxID=135826 RepID=A0A0C2RY40_9BACL|nr:competence protein ComK [Jeotgalibacillus alimentarius]KIL46704.1 hypothetical protein KP77_28310 [Jeotgalibacillus alimentarius]